MSHVVDLGLLINDEKCLIEAAADVGLELRQKNTFYWFGTSVGDYPLPVGFAKEDMGKCEFALGIKGNSKAYEIGVVRRRDGKPGYTMLFDFWAGGHGLEEKIGKDGGLLKQAYNTRVTMAEARRNGYRVQRTVDEEGYVTLDVRA